MTDDQTTPLPPPSWWVLLAVGLVAIAGMVYLAFVPTTVHQTVDDDDHPGYTTTCASLVATGWPGDVHPSERLTSRGITETDTSEPPYDACHARRTLAAAGIGALAAPASALVYLVAVGRRRTPRVDAPA
ncbi:hypothetical protein [Nocardioides zeae]|uniref:Uncharacterized protein n=1 Tax=Nocardioides zeae TaxID=1457234 RepID=A0A6P0HNH8_9ACTN|nr:hypothetical protein [Nocardioides zeae]NEN79787.1 hypothetical protein [Nocardioides zeae]